MTETEKHAAYGKAMLDLRQAKFDLAAAQKRLNEWSANSREIIASVENFCKEPLRIGPDQRPVADYAYGWHSKLESLSLPDLVHDVFTIARKLETLQGDVDRFEK